MRGDCEAAPAEGHVVVAVPVASKRMVTIGEDSVLWRVDEGGCDGADVWEASGLLDDLAGAFVRIRPPKGTSDKTIDELVACIAGKRGEAAAGVKVERPRRDAVVPEARAREPHKTARQVVSAMVEGRDALRVVVERIMDTEGL